MFVLHDLKTSKHEPGSYGESKSIDHLAVSRGPMKFQADQSPQKKSTKQHELDTKK